MRKLLKVILDCDDVLFMCNQRAVERLNLVNDTHYSINDINRWGILGNELDERLKYFSEPPFMGSLPLYPGAKEFVSELSKKAEVVIATNVQPKCAGARVNAIIRNFPEIKPSNILIGARKDLLKADMMLDDAPQNLEAANVEYPVLFRQPWNYGKTGLFSVSLNQESDYDAIVLVGPSGSGKKELAERLISKNPKIQRISSYTTKNSGLNYHHVTTAEFEAMRSEFFETSSYMGHLYGTKEEDIREAMDIGKIPLLIMDINGMIAMKAKFKTLAVYVHADRETCIRDLLSRELPIEELVQRLAALDLEMRNEQFCDITLTTDTEISL